MAMIINGEEIDFSGPPVNPGIRMLWDINDTGYAHHPRACSVYSHWMVGSDDRQIATFFNISTEEIHADLEHIKALLSEEMRALHFRERDEILASEERFRKEREEMAADLSQPIDALIERGINPIDAMQRYRQAVEYEAPSNILADLKKRDANICRDGKEGETTEDPSQIKALRRQSNQSSIEGSADDLNPQAAYELIAELRRTHQKPSTKAATQSHIAQEPEPVPIQQNRPNKSDPDLKFVGVKTVRTDRRITVRLDPDLFEKVNSHCNDLGIDLSTAIRRALSQFLEGDSASKDNANITMPAEASALMGRYQVWGSDLKEKLRENFLQLLAMAYVTERRWPRAMWVKELYRALLQSYQCLEANDVRQK
jgi:hypothetical protein